MTQLYRQRPFYMAMVFSVAFHLILLAAVLIQRELPKLERWLKPMRVEFLNQTVSAALPPKEADALAEVNQQARAQRNDPEETTAATPALPVPLTAPPTDPVEKIGKTMEAVTPHPDPLPAANPLTSHLTEKRPDATAIQERSTSSRDKAQRRQKPNEPVQGIVFPLKLTPSLGEMAEWDRRQQVDRHQRQTDRGEATVDLNTRETRYAAYFNGVKQRVEQVWNYPIQAKQERLAGSLMLEFTIDRDGRLLEIEVIRSSGLRVLDEAAVSAVKRAVPFPPLPADWRLEKLHVKTNFEYIMRRAKWGG